MVLLRKFLCCCELEAGGYTVGWCGVFLSLAAIVAMILVGMGEVHGCQSIDSCYAVLGFFGVIVLSLLLLLLIDFALIVGTKTRSPKRLLPALLLHGIIFAASALFIVLAIVIRAVIHAVCYTLLCLVDGYVLLVIFVLYRKFKREHFERKRLRVSRL